MRVVFINRFYWPAEPATAQLLTDLAEALAAAGWDVSVITGHPGPGCLPAERRHGVSIVRVGRPMAATQNLLRRAVDFLRFHRAIKPALERHVGAGDVVVPLTDPPLIGVTASRLARSRDAKVVHWIHDIYPEIVRAVRPSWATALVDRALRPRRNTAWRHAHACVVLGEDMTEVVREAGVTGSRIHVVPNWAPRGVERAAAADIQKRRSEWGLEGRFVIGYSGNLGRVHDLGRLLEVARRLSGEPGFTFLFVGHGAAFSALRREAAAAGSTQIRFLPPQPRRELGVSLSVPDVHMISVRAGCEHFVFPSKLYGAAAVARPVLLLGDPGSRLAALVRDHAMGAAFAPGAVEPIVAYLRTLAADPAQRERQAQAAAAFHEANGGIARATRQWETLLNPTTVPAVTSTPGTGRRPPDNE